MLLVSHIAIALLSIAYTAFTFFIPSQTKIRISSWLVGLTLASGTLLVVSTHSGLVQACMTGLLYLGFNLAGIIAASRKLAAIESHTD